jgi:hypothetical protein
MLVGRNSTPLQSRLGPGCVRKVMKVRPGVAAECKIRGKLSDNRCIHRRCRSIRVSFAVKCPRPMTVISARVARIAAA